MRRSHSLGLAAILCLASACSLNRAAFTFNPVKQGTVATPGAVIEAEDGSFRLVAGERFTTPFNQGDECLLKPAADNYEQAVHTGARPVRILLGDGRTMYGLLSLCGAPAGATGPATRSYEIQVPESYIAATSGGRVSVVYEPFTSGKMGAKAWILWLSESSFGRVSGVAGADTARGRLESGLRGVELSYKLAKWSTVIGAPLTVLGVVFLSSHERGDSVALPVITLTGGALGLIFGFSFGVAAKGEEAKARRLLADSPRQPIDEAIAGNGESDWYRGAMLSVGGSF